MEEKSKKKSALDVLIRLLKCGCVLLSIFLVVLVHHTFNPQCFYDKWSRLTSVHEMLDLLSKGPKDADGIISVGAGRRTLYVKFLGDDDKGRRLVLASGSREALLAGFDYRTDVVKLTYLHDNNYRGIRVEFYDRLNHLNYTRIYQGSNVLYNVGAGHIINLMEYNACAACANGKTLKTLWSWLGVRPFGDKEAGFHLPALPKLPKVENDINETVKTVKEWSLWGKLKILLWCALGGILIYRWADPRRKDDKWDRLAKLNAFLHNTEAQLASESQNVFTIGEGNDHQFFLKRCCECNFHIALRAEDLLSEAGHHLSISFKENGSPYSIIRVNGDDGWYDGNIHSDYVPLQLHIGWDWSLFRRLLRAAGI